MRARAVQSQRLLVESPPSLDDTNVVHMARRMCGCGSGSSFLRLW